MLTCEFFYLPSLQSRQTPHVGWFPGSMRATLPSKWESIGKLLGFSQEDLDNYEVEYRNNHQRLRIVILDWPRWRKLRPTWKALIEALRDVTVGDEGAAHDLQALVMMGTRPG